MFEAHIARLDHLFCVQFSVNSFASEKRSVISSLRSLFLRDCWSQESTINISLILSAHLNVTQKNEHEQIWFEKLIRPIMNNKSIWVFVSLVSCWIDSVSDIFTATLSISTVSEVSSSLCPPNWTLKFVFIRKTSEFVIIKVWRVVQLRWNFEKHAPAILSAELIFITAGWFTRFGNSNL